MVVACGLSQYSLALFHLINHAWFKALLFLSAGVIEFAPTLNSAIIWDKYLNMLYLNILTSDNQRGNVFGNLRGLMLKISNIKNSLSYCSNSIVNASSFNNFNSYLAGLIEGMVVFILQNDLEIIIIKLFLLKLLFLLILKI